jgi:hypothetical protein
MWVPGAWVANDLIEGLHTIARQQNRYLWAVVREALLAHVTRHITLVTVPHGK